MKENVQNLKEKHSTVFEISNEKICFKAFWITVSFIQFRIVVVVILNLWVFLLEWASFIIYNFQNINERTWFSGWHLMSVSVEQMNSLIVYKIWVVVLIFSFFCNLFHLMSRCTCLIPFSSITQFKRN